MAVGFDGLSVLLVDSDFLADFSVESDAEAAALVSEADAESWVWEALVDKLLELAVSDLSGVGDESGETMDC